MVKVKFTLDRQTDRVIPIYPQTSLAGGITHPPPTNVIVEIKILLEVLLNSVERLQRRRWKSQKPIRGQGGYLVFPINVI